MTYTLFVRRRSSPVQRQNECKKYKIYIYINNIAIDKKMKKNPFRLNNTRSSAVEEVAYFRRYSGG